MLKNTDKYIPSVDRVRTEAQERLDKPDFDATIALADESLQRQFGALLGFGSGVTSPPSLDTSGVTTIKQLIRLGTFQYYISVPSWADDGVTFKGWRGVFVTFDPTDSGQDAVINIAAAYQAANGPGGDPYSSAATPGIYAQPQLQDMDTDARRKWAGTSEQAVSMTTRSRVRTAFKLSTAAPEAASNVGWALIGQIQWNGAVPFVHWRSWLDNAVAEAHSLDVPSGTTGLDSFVTARSSAFPLVSSLSSGSLILSNNAFYGAPPQRDLGIIQILTVLRKRFADIISGTSSSAANWITSVLPASLQSLQDAVGVLNAWKAAFDSTMNGVWPTWTRDFITFSAQVLYDSGTQTYSFALGTMLPAPVSGSVTLVRSDFSMGGTNRTVCDVQFATAIQAAGWSLQAVSASSESDLLSATGTAWYNETMASVFTAQAIRVTDVGGANPRDTARIAQFSSTGSGLSATRDGSFFATFTFRRSAT